MNEGVGLKKRIRDYYNEHYVRAPEVEPLEGLKQQTRLSALRVLLNMTVQKNSVLIVGCGAGADLDVVPGGVVAFDLSSRAVERAREASPLARLLVADACDLPFVQGSFDVVICSEVLEHLPDPELAVDEFDRVLKTGGTLILTVPNWLNWFGIARKGAEFILRRPVTASNQPVDTWYTMKSLNKLISPHFTVQKSIGIWYFPPTGRGRWRIPDTLVYPVFKVLGPIDAALGRMLPKLGHSVGVIGTKTNARKS
ncbi:MAG: class I SAM-dependent methyltransferase [Candidatus Binatia bacterium]